MLRVILKSEGGGGCLFKGCLFDILAKGGGLLGGRCLLGRRCLLGGRCLLECGHREIRYTSVNPNFFLDD